MDGSPEAHCFLLAGRQWPYRKCRVQRCQRLRAPILWTGCISGQ
jgi:hypothetical protein